MAALAALGVDGRALVVVDRDDAAAALSFRNLPEVQLIEPGELNAYDVLCNDWIVFTEDTLPDRRRRADSAGRRGADDEPTRPRPPRPSRRRASAERSRAERRRRADERRRRRSDES